MRRRSARLAASRQSHVTDDDDERPAERPCNATVEELAKIACKHMRMKIFGESTQKTQGETGTQQQQSSSMPDVILLDHSNDSTGTRRGKVETISRRGHLSSCLDPGVSEELYFNIDTKESHGCVQLNRLHGDPHETLLKKSVITSDFEKRDAAPPIHQSFRKMQRLKKAEREGTTGTGWFNMPAPELTQDMKNDLRVLQMRNVLDRSHHYKSSDWKKGKLPKYFQVGTVVSGAAEFYSARIPKRQRKRTMVEELLADDQLKRYNKKKFVELQKKFQSGTRRHHNMKKKHKNKSV